MASNEGSGKFKNNWNSSASSDEFRTVLGFLWTNFYRVNTWTALIGARSQILRSRVNVVSMWRVKSFVSPAYSTCRTLGGWIRGPYKPPTQDGSSGIKLLNYISNSSITVNSLKNNSYWPIHVNNRHTLNFYYRHVNYFYGCHQVRWGITCVSWFGTGFCHIA